MKSPENNENESDNKKWAIQTLPHSNHQKADHSLHRSRSETNETATEMSNQTIYTKRRG